MRFIQIINQKRFTLVSIFLFIYIALNFLDGERGLISYFEKQKIKRQLLNQKKLLSIQLVSVEKKNSLLTENIDKDYLEMIYREKFLVGKNEEKIYKSD